MRVLKIVAEGVTTSFRYPHFMQQIHPTFEMPPPATIYGHISSALGDWFDPQGISFAYHFTYESKAIDTEHIIVLAPKGGTLEGSDYPKVLEGKVTPFQRHLLYKPTLTLYLNRPDWEHAFRCPRYPVVLGRSQDLFMYTHVGIVDLVQASDAYFERTLLPYNTNAYTGRGYAILMPRYLDVARNRYPNFARYFVVSERIFTNKPGDFLYIEGKKPAAFWVDPTSPQYQDLYRGLSFLCFIGEEDEPFSVA
jgi:CRISPR-associated protein Cas5t